MIITVKACPCNLVFTRRASMLLTVSSKTSQNGDGSTYYGGKPAKILLCSIFSGRAFPSGTAPSRDVPIRNCTLNSYIQNRSKINAGLFPPCVGERSHWQNLLNYRKRFSAAWNSLKTPQVPTHQVPEKRTTQLLGHCGILPDPSRSRFSRLYAVFNVT